MLATEEIIKILQELWKYKETDKYTEAEIRQALEMAIKALKQEPKTGHWIKHNESITLLTGTTITGGVVCSECGYKTHNKTHVIIGCPYKYCPNCGSKMEGGTE